MILSAVIIILLFLRCSGGFPFFIIRNTWWILIRRVALQSTFALRCRFLFFFLIYLISFIFHFLAVVGDGNSVAASGERSARFDFKRAFDSHSATYAISELAAAESKQKDIKLKVVKTSSRFSIYFQLHFALLQGALRKCVFVCFQPQSRKKKEHECRKRKSQSV